VEEDTSEGACADQALDLLAKGHDLVFADLMMPDRSGMDAVEAVARDHPHTGVVMFTGFATVDSAVASMKLGALDYLPKPFTPEELVQVTEKALDKTWKARRDREIEQTYAQAEKAIASSLDLKEILNLICASVVKLFMKALSPDALQEGPDSEIVSFGSADIFTKGMAQLKEHRRRL
jgi:DNA-binding NtrC family response regulator